MPTLVLTGVLLLLALPGNASESMPVVRVDELGIEITPVARYVTGEPSFNRYRDFRRQMQTGKVTYDETVRHPFLPLGGLVVDCQTTGRVGATFLLQFDEIHTNHMADRRTRIRAKDQHFEYRWRHTGHASDGPRYTDRFRLHPHREVRAISTGLTLHDSDRVDGTIHLEVTLESHVIYKTQYHLAGCSRDED